MTKPTIVGPFLDHVMISILKFLFYTIHTQVKHITLYKQKYKNPWVASQVALNLMSRHDVTKLVTQTSLTKPWVSFNELFDFQLHHDSGVIDFSSTLYIHFTNYLSFINVTVIMFYSLAIQLKLLAFFIFQLN